MVPVKNNNRIRKTRRGFTLLEILLVVGLLALLAAFVVPALTGQSDEAKKNIAKAAIGPNGPLSQSIDLFKVNTGRYPAELKDLIEKPGDEDLASKWRGPYIKDVGGLKDPWDHDYQYNAEGEKNKGGIDLWSMGPDGIDGNEDDIVNWKDDRR